MPTPNQAKAFRTKTEALAFVLGVKAGMMACSSSTLEVMELRKREGHNKPWVVLLSNLALFEDYEWEETGTDEDWTIELKGLDTVMVVPLEPKETLDLRMAVAHTELVREFEMMISENA